VAISAAFLATSNGASLLGISQQLSGESGLNAPAFGYCGSIFPCPSLNASDPEIAEAVRRAMVRHGEVLQREFGLRGLFGLDFMFDGREVWLTEINPRYTASMELMEIGLGLPFLELHRAGCESLVPHWNAQHVEPSGRYWAKVILYADREGRAADLSHLIPAQVSLQELPQVADIPVTGSEIVVGQPVLTCLGEGTDASTLVAQLSARASDLWRLF
jgi:predicted ATP-grasp superfamily ATP-dependent carboligase